jgi:hypothetical protein
MTPSLAMAADTSDICSGVAVTSNWPMPVRAVDDAFIPDG